MSRKISQQPVVIRMSPLEPWPPRPRSTSAEIISTGFSGGSLLMSFLAFAASLAALFVGCWANDIAREANKIAVALNRENGALQRRMQDYEISLKKPRLLAIQRLYSIDGRFIVTVQNEGERDAALLWLAVAPVGPSIQGAPGGQPPTMPVETMVESIGADLQNNNGTAPYFFSPPRVVKPGGVVNLDIKLPVALLSGEIVLRYANGEMLSLGTFQWPSTPTADDPFGMPAVPPAPDTQP